VVRYNISQNDHHRGINLSGQATNSLIYNNTIYVGKNEDVDLIVHSDWNGWAANTSFFNNVFYVDGTARFSYATSRRLDGAYIVAPGPGKSSSNVFDYNLYYGVRPQEDPHGLINNPLMSDPGSAKQGRKTASGYLMRSGSPALDSGKTIENNGGRDFFGTIVPQCGGVDRGAVESTDCRSSR